MSIISWNCQGFGVALTVQNLKEVVRKEKPQLVFLMETKKQINFLDRKRRAFGFDEGWYVNPIGKSGGLALWWTNEVKVNIISSSKNIIHTKIESLAVSLPAYITFLYGPPVEQERNGIWDKLRAIARYMSEPWLCIGDFNEILSQSEKWGGNPHTLRRVINFQLLVSDCELLEVESKGASYTWCNQRLGEAHIKERLDRALGNLSFKDLFPQALVFHVEPVASDHHLLLLKLCHQGLKTPRPFRFEAIWVSHAEFKPLMKACWGMNTVSGMTEFETFVAKLDHCRGVLIEWSKRVFPNNRKVISGIVQQMDMLKQQVLTEPLKLQIEGLKDQLEEIWTKEETYWW